MPRMLSLINVSPVKNPDILLLSVILRLPIYLKGEFKI